MSKRQLSKPPAPHKTWYAYLNEVQRAIFVSYPDRDEYGDNLFIETVQPDGSSTKTTLGCIKAMVAEEFIANGLVEKVQAHLEKMNDPHEFQDSGLELWRKMKVYEKRN